jgi:hypothetical protein
MNQSVEIKLVSPGTWQPDVEEVFSRLSSRAALVAQSILRTLQNRHIGITPRLAAELALLLGNAYGAGQGQSAWHDVLKRLRQEISGTPFSFGIMLNTVPLYSVIRLALPVIEEASHRIGLSCLFCQDDIESDITPADYQNYSRALATEIRQMAGSRVDFFRLFWTDRALTLAACSRRGPGEFSGSGLPETDPGALGLLLRLNPELSQTPPLSSHSRYLTDPQKHQEVSRLKEGGLSGIHITRRLEDIGDILLSEFVNPPAVLADRLINNGFLALRRQTRREQLRDVLIAALMPVEAQARLSTEFIKACWFDFLGRFGHMLVKSGRKRSEFRWLEGDSLGQVRSLQFLLQDLPVPDTPARNLFDTHSRREFLMALGWLPSYLDNRSRFEPIPGYAVKSGPDAVSTPLELSLASAVDWAFAVWRTQRESVQWLVHEPESPLAGSSGKKLLDLNGFAVVHLMLFLPAERRRQDREISAAARLGSLYSGFGMGNVPGRNVSITWVPRQVSALSQWAFDCRGQRESLLFPPGKAHGSFNSHQIATRLEQAWRNRLIKELRDPQGMGNP